MESLWIENRTNAIGIETDLFLTKPCGPGAAVSGEGGGNFKKSPPSCLLAKERRLWGVFAVVARTAD